MRCALVFGLFTLALAAAPRPASAFVWPNVPEQIADGLRSADLFERRAAAARIVELPPELAYPLVERAMADPDVEVKLDAAEAAVASRMPRAGDRVVEWLADSDARLRLAACSVIRAAPTDRSVAALGRVLGDVDSHVRLAAALAIGAAGLPSGVSPLLGHLDDPTPEVREEVARALGRIGDARAVLPLVSKVQDSVPDVRRVVARALGDLGDVRAASALMLAVQDGAAEVRLEAVTALGKLRSEEAVATIAPLADPDAYEAAAAYAPKPPGYGGVGAADVRAAAVRALGRIGSDAAVKALAGALAKDDPSTRSPVREALVAAGKRSSKAMIALLRGSPTPQAGAAAALVLGALKDEDGVPAIVEAMRRGAVPLRWALRALARIGAPSALPPVLEVIDDPDPTARKEAIRAATALLDPTRPDGRPVDPARAALADPATPVDERIELCRMLGRTGAPRAQAVLLPLAKAKPPALRLAVIEALGTLRTPSPETDRVLVDALDDESAEVRLRAAIALARSGGAGAAPLLLERLTVAAEQDRGALGVALSGALANATDEALAERVRAAVGAAPEGARDALIEGLGRMRGPAAGAALTKLASGGVDDRRKVAEALATHPDGTATVVQLAKDPDPSVRATAIWSLGALGDVSALPLLQGALADLDGAVAGNAAAAIGRVAARSGAGGADLATKVLCPALSDPRPYVRANALEGVSLASGSCPSARELLARDPSEVVRVAAADVLGRGKPSDAAADRRALVRCASEDRDGAVATRCGSPLAPTTGVDDVAVYVVRESESSPEPRAPFALVRADGLVRLGAADRRGELFEAAAPRGAIHLDVPAGAVR